MQVMERLHEDVLILLISGRFTHYARRVFQAVIKNAEASGVRHIILDFSHVTWMDSAGLGLLALAHLACEGHQISMSLVGLQPPVIEVIEQAGLSQFIPIFPTEECALGHLSCLRV